ncbi:MAG: class C sortase [Hornefia sp.]|nr:class C sortase [Hornefia sp.]
METQDKIKRLKGRFSTLLVALMFLAGIGIMLYPAVSDLWNRQWNNQMKSVYRNSVNTYSEETLKEEWGKARAYNIQHKTNTVRDAFDNDEYIKTHPYSDLLNPGKNGIMGYVEIPKINQEIVIYHGTASKSLERGCGHVEGTSLPTGGKNTHAVIAAHRGLPGAKLFSDLDKLKEGDNFYLRILDKKLAYRVDQIKTVKPENVSYLEIVAGEDYVTLLTCTPYGVNTHRLMVRGCRAAYKEHEGIDSPLMSFFDSWQFKILIAAAVIAAAVFFVRRYRNRKG